MAEESIVRGALPRWGVSERVAISYPLPFRAYMKTQRIYTKICVRSLVRHAGNTCPSSGREMTVCIV